MRERGPRYKTWLLFTYEMIGRVHQYPKVLKDNSMMSDRDRYS